MAFRDLARRALGAARLDPAIYEEVEHDASATPQAFVVVLVSGIAAALGRFGELAPAALVAAMVVAIVGWAIWAALCLVIGTRLLPEPETRSDAGELLRVLGFAAAPGVVQALGVVAPLRVPAIVVADVWMILTMVVAVRQALDYTSTARAFAVCAVGFAVQLLVTVALLAALGRTLVSREVALRRPSDAMPTAGYVGVVKPSGVAPPVQ